VTHLTSAALAAWALVTFSQPARPKSLPPLADTSSGATARSGFSTSTAVSSSQPDTPRTHRDGRGDGWLGLTPADCRYTLGRRTDRCYLVKSKGPLTNFQA
jgi:hypothetical protein